jgi:excisionase family DNA binding protein
MANNDLTSQRNNSKAHRDSGGARRPRFYSVAEAAAILGMSSMTLYRAIAAGEFPAVRVRGRLIIPVRAIDQLVDLAVTGGVVVDASTWSATTEAQGGAL